MTRAMYVAAALYFAIAAVGGAWLVVPLSAVCLWAAWRIP